MRLASEKTLRYWLSDETECQACHKEEGIEKQRLNHCPEWNEVRREMPEAFRK